MERGVAFVLDGAHVEVPAVGSLLDALREELGIRSVKDGCSPQGQCGCCTVWVDGQPRVSCVTPVARVAGRAVTTVDGLDDRDRWAAAFCANGGSQCGFCTPGIVMRAAALDPPRRSSRAAIDQAMLAHLCRCTGWQPIADSIMAFDAGSPPPRSTPNAARRAAIEGRVAQSVGPDVVLGRGGFADDTSPPDALVALRAVDGEWVVADSLHAARALSAKVQGRRTTAPLSWPVAVAPGDWVRTLQTTWVEPAYLEPDATWCSPGGEPVSTHGNGGAFGGKQGGDLGDVARRLADAHGRPVRVLLTREDVVRLGPKRPPLAAGIRADGSGVVRVVATPGIRDVIAAVHPRFEVIEVDVAGPSTSCDLRAAGWAELTALVAATDESATVDRVTAPNGAHAEASFDGDGALHVSVACGDPLDPVVLRSYCTGAAHMALGLVTSEALSVDADGVIHDLTIRSFGVLRSMDTPPIHVTVEPGSGEPVNGSDAVFAAVLAAAWRRSGHASRWPVGGSGATVDA